MAKIYALRHGQTEWNLQRRIQGHLDSELTELGEKQARALGEAFKKIKIDALYSSDLGRAVKTVTPVQEMTDLPLITKKCLRETNLGIWSGKTGKEIEAAITNDFEFFKKRDPDFRIPEGETLRERQHRTVSCFEELAKAHAGQIIAVMTHGGILDSLFRHVVEMPLESNHQFSISNASINVVSKNDSGWRLESWGNVSHLSDL